MLQVLPAQVTRQINIVYMRSSMARGRNDTPTISETHVMHCPVWVLWLMALLCSGRARARVCGVWELGHGDCREGAPQPAEAGGHGGHVCAVAGDAEGDLQGVGLGDVPRLRTELQGAPRLYGRDTGVCMDNETSSTFQVAHSFPLSAVERRMITRIRYLISPWWLDMVYLTD